MLTPPGILAETIIASLREHYGLRIQRVTFLPLGADVNAAVYRAEADDGADYFLKLKRGAFDKIAVDVPAALHAQGIRQVMAPLATLQGRWWTHGHGFIWLLYPFFEGHNAYLTPLSDAQWIAFGTAFRAIHSATLPSELAARVPREDYSPQRWRDVVREYDGQVERRAFDDPLGDPIARQLSAFWVARRSDIRAMLARADALGVLLRRRADAFVVCHTDMHPGNVLVGADGNLALVDWDEPLYAPKERDLMLVDGGVSDDWNDARQDALFFQGYGPAAIDPAALSYYRYERILADVASYGMQIFEAEGSAEDRETGLRQLTGQFLPDSLVASAHRAYETYETYETYERPS